MAAPELLCQIIGININKLSREESLILEIELFVRLCVELKEIFRSKYKSYFRLMKFNTLMEDEMLENNFLCHVINDILLTKEYSLKGIAYYTQVPEDVICDVLTGLNTEPSFPLSRKLIDLHRSVRPHLYQEILKKITAEYLI